MANLKWISPHVKMLGNINTKSYKPAILSSVPEISVNLLNAKCSCMSISMGSVNNMHCTQFLMCSSPAKLYCGLTLPCLVSLVTFLNHLWSQAAHFLQRWTCTMYFSCPGLHNVVIIIPFGAAVMKRSMLESTFLVASYIVSICLNGVEQCRFPPR